jgi:hypothetical protein
MSDVYPKYQYFPSTSPPPSFAHRIADVFAHHRSSIDTVKLKKGLTSNDVLAVIRPNLIQHYAAASRSRGLRKKEFAF